MNRFAQFGHSLLTTGAVLIGYLIVNRDASAVQTGYVAVNVLVGCWMSYGNGWRNAKETA